MKSILLALIFLLSSFLAPQFVRAQEEAVVASPSAQLPPKTIDYPMPYPGLLPDNPLYSIKIIRDHIVEFLISEPMKKAEFDLLQSDKRVNAGTYLLKKQSPNRELAFTTISKGENYFDEAVDKAIEAKSQNIMVSDFAYKLMTAAQKHQEIFAGIASQGSADEKQRYEKLRLHSQTQEEKVSSKLLDIKYKPQ